MTTLATADNQLADDVDEYADYIRQITGDGEAIVDCLVRIMEDDSVGAKPYERLDAQLLLDSIGFGRIAVDQASVTPQAGALPAPPPMPAAPGLPRAANDATPRRPVLTLSEETLFHLPPIVRQKTDRGRKMADFLNAVVRGELNDFKPHHWIRAAKHLAARAYSRQGDPERPGLSPQDAMKLIDKLFPGFKNYHRVDMKHIIHLGFKDMAADDHGPLHGSDLSRPYNRPDFEAARAQFEAGVQSEPEPEPYRPKLKALRAQLLAHAEQRRLEDEEYERLEEERREKDENTYPADRRSEETDVFHDPPDDHQPRLIKGFAYRPDDDDQPRLVEGFSGPPDDYEPRPGRPMGLSRWERKAMEKGDNLGWDCGIPP